MNPYSKPTSPSSPSTNIPARFTSSIAKRPLAESGYSRSASKDRRSGPSDFTAKEDLEYLKSGYDSARPYYLGSSIGSQGGPVTSAHMKLSTSDLAQNYTTNNTNNYGTDSNHMSKSIGFSPINGSANTFLSPQRFVPIKVDSHPNANHDAQNYYSADANLEQTSKPTAPDNFNLYSKQKDEKSRKYSEERLQAILENVRNRKFDDQPRYGNPYSDFKVSTPDLSKEHRDSFRSEDRPLQMRSQNISGIQTSSNLTTERGNKEILSYLTNANTVPVKPGPYIDLTSLHGGPAQTSGPYSHNPASGIANYNPLTYTPVNAFNNVQITEPTPKPTTPINYSSLYDTMKKNPIPIENNDVPKISKEDEKGFSFRDNKEKEISFQRDSNLLGSSLLQSNYSLKQEVPSSATEYPKKEYESVSQQPETKLRTSEQPQPYQPKPLENLKATTTAAVQTLSDSVRLREQGSPYEIYNLTSPPVRRHHHLDTASFESNLHLSSADSSMSKKTFYTIEHNNPLAIRAFKDTVAGLAVSSTPEKNTNSHFESPSLFEDLQRALSKQHVQINRIIIETIENYPSRGSPNIYKHQPEEYSRPDTVVAPSKALFEPPKNINKLVFQEVRKEPNELRESTPDLIPQKLDYSNPASSINYIQHSEGGLISNEPSVRGETEHKEIEKKAAFESNVSSFAQQKPTPFAPPDFNRAPSASVEKSSSQYTQEQKPSIKDVDFKNETESQKSAIVIEEPLSINYSAQPSERNNEEIRIQKPEESEKKVDETQHSLKQPVTEIAVKSPELSVKKDLSEHAQEIQPPLSINDVFQPEEANQSLQEIDKPEEPENNNFEDANDSQEVEIRREESEKSGKIEPSQNIQPHEEPEPHVIPQKVVEEPKVVVKEEELKTQLPEEVKRQVPEEIKGQVVPEEVKRQVPEEVKNPAISKNPEPQSSNLAVKAVIGLLVILLLAILGSELMPSAGDEQ